MLVTLASEPLQIMAVNLSQHKFPDIIKNQVVFSETIKKIVDDYLICDTMVVPNSRFSKKLMETMKQVKKRGLIFWIMLVANGIFFTVKSLFTPGKHFMDDLFTIYGKYII